MLRALLKGEAVKMPNTWADRPAHRSKDVCHHKLPNTHVFPPGIPTTTTQDWAMDLCMALGGLSCGSIRYMMTLKASTEESKLLLHDYNSFRLKKMDFEDLRQLHTVHQFGAGVSTLLLSLR